jgi:hypothetical protein
VILRRLLPHDLFFASPCVEIIDRPLERHRIGAARGDQLNRPASPDGNQRKFRGDKESVGCDQDKNYQDAEQSAVLPSPLGMFSSPCFPVRADARRIDETAKTGTCC